MCVIATYRRHFVLLIHLQSRVESVRCLRRTLLVPFGWRVGAEDSRSVIVWIKRGGINVNVTCKGAVVRRSLTVEIWFDFPGLMRTKARARARCVDGREENGTSFRASEGKTSTWLSWGALGTLRRNLTVPQSTFLGISIRYVERKTPLDFSGFGYGLCGVGCLHIARTFEFSVNPVEHNMGKYDKWDSVPLTLGASSRTGVPSAR